MRDCGYLNAPRAMRQSLMPDPERAAIVRRLFTQYATGTYTKQETLQKATPWGLTNRRGQPLSSQAIGMLLRNRMYIGIIDVPDFGIRDRRGDFDPLIIEEIFYKAQALLSGQVHVIAPLLRNRREREWLLLEMPLRERASRAGLQVALEADRPRLVWELNDDMKLPRSIPRRVRAAAGVVVV